MTVFHFRLGLVAACLATCLELGSLLSLTAPVPTALAFDVSGAAGLGVGWQTRRDYGASTFSRVMPEVVFYGYLGPLGGNVHLRPGARLGYTAFQPEMPSAVRVEESDLSVSGEIGVVYDWYLVPSVSLGGGLIHRSIALKTAAPVSAGSEQISRTENLPHVFAQVGVGLPLWNGFIVLEPYARFASVQGDGRVGTQFGVEITAGVL